MSIYQEKSEVLQNIHINSNYYLMTISSEKIVQEILPGQFINIKVVNSFDPLLKRPFSPFLLNKKENTIDIFYKVVGKGTNIMSSLKRGDIVTLAGPHGNRFTIDKDLNKVAVVGRGVGIAPLVFLSQFLHEKGVEIYAFLSVNNPQFIVGKKEFERFGAHIYYSTSNNELVTDRLWNLLKEDVKIDAIYTCGSRRLRREISKMSEEYGILSEVSLEAVMACGIGVCMGCTVKIGTNSHWRYKRVCVDGPIFKTGEVIDE